MNIAGIQLETGEIENAAKALNQVIHLTRDTKDEIVECNALRLLGAAYKEQKQYKRAEKVFLDSLQLAEEIQSLHIL